MIYGQIFQTTPERPGLLVTALNVSDISLINLSNDGKVPVTVQMVQIMGQGNPESEPPSLKKLSAGSERMVYQWELEPGEFTTIAGADYAWTTFDTLYETTPAIALLVFPKKGSEAVVGYRIKADGT